MKLSLRMRYKCCGKSWKGTPEDEILEATSANTHRGCGHDMLGQTVPSTGSSNMQGRPDH